MSASSGQHSLLVYLAFTKEDKAATKLLQENITTPMPSIYWKISCKALVT